MTVSSIMQRALTSLLSDSLCSAVACVNDPLQLYSMNSSISDGRTLWTLLSCSLVTAEASNNTLLSL